MAQWQELLRLDSELQSRVSELYARRFPREIRHCLSMVIESQDWDSAAVDENKARTCFNVLLTYLEEQWSRSVQENNILQGPDLPGMIFWLRHFQDKPLKLAVILSECLKEEQKILASASETQACSSPTVEQEWRELDNRVNELKTMSLEVKRKIKSLEDLNEKLDYIQKTWQTQVMQHVELVKSQARVEEECQRQANIIAQNKQISLQQIENTLKLTMEILVTLTDVELPKWKQRQQMACIGAPVDTSLHHLQKWFTAVAEVLLLLRDVLQKLQEQDDRFSSTHSSNLPGAVRETETLTSSLLTKLLTNALVVEKQPMMSSLPHRPLILKTGVRFSVTVRFLANLPEFKCLLKVKPVFDKDVEETNKGFRQFEFESGNDCKVLDMDAPDGGLVAEFGVMSLKNIRGKSRGSNVTRLAVTKELHIIKFVTTFQHAGLKCDIEAASLPVVVVSSSSQIPSAWASIMWYNMLPTSESANLSLFVNPPPLTWEQLAAVLSWQFLSVGQRGLNEEQLSMLRDRLVGNSDGLVQWNEFAENESAWIWIDGILDLIKRHLLDLWRDGLIMGFVCKKKTRSLLRKKMAGTFLIRFSESSKDGAVTFSWVEHKNGENLVHAVQPYSKQELETMALPDIIYHYSLRSQSNATRSPLVYLYPDIPRDAVFGPYYKTSARSAPESVVDGYVNRSTIHESFDPTPPSSPGRDTDTDTEMDVDENVNMDINQLIQELFADLIDVSAVSDYLSTTEVTNSVLNNNNNIDLIISP